MRHSSTSIKTADHQKSKKPERVSGETSSSMPKKRFTTQFSKPQSTVHPSLSSAAGTSSNRNAAPPTVNDLINSSRKSTATTGTSVASPTPTLPPQIRHLLSQPETPTPTPRVRPRRRLDVNGRLLPAGPPAPRSWLERSHHALGPMRRKREERVYPTDLYHLPGLKETSGKSLQDVCMRQMARHWEYLREYEQNNLADLPTRVRMELLSFVAVYGPDEGVGFDGLRHLVSKPDIRIDDSTRTVENDICVEMSPSAPSQVSKSDMEQLTNGSPLEDWDEDSSDSSLNSHLDNEGFFRLDLSGAIGNSVSFKQLTTLLERPTPSLSPPIPHLTHLSLSHPSNSVPWRGLLALSKHIPTLTHLSLAHWPVPTLTPNARTAIMTSPYGKDVQYGGTNFYSHTLDHDFHEAAQILRRLANRLYGLEYLDLSGCVNWPLALCWTGLNQDSGSNSFGGNGDFTSTLAMDDLAPATTTSNTAMRETTQGIDWTTQLLKLSTLKLSSNIVLTDTSAHHSLIPFVSSVEVAMATEIVLKWWMTKGGRGVKGKWVDVVYEDWTEYRDLWKGAKEAPEVDYRNVLNRLAFDGLEEEVLLLGGFRRMERVGGRDEEAGGEEGGAG